MKPLLITTLVLFQACNVFAGKTFGFQNKIEPLKEEAEFIDQRILPARLLILTPASSLADVFRLFPTMDKAGDRGPRGKEYYDSLPDTHFYRTVSVQEDKSGIHNISFNSSFSSPSLEDVEKTVGWLLTVFGEPSVAFTRDITTKTTGDELIALVWTKPGITIGFSLHFASGVHSSLLVCRGNTKVEDIFSTEVRTNLSPKKSDINTAVTLWATSIAGISK